MVSRDIYIDLVSRIYSDNLKVMDRCQFWLVCDLFSLLLWVKSMISNNTVIIIVDKDLNLVEVDEAYSKFVGKGQENSLLSNVYPFDQHLLYEMVEEVEKNDKSTACFRLLGNSDEYRWIFASCIRQKDSEEFSLKLILHDISELG